MAITAVIKTGGKQYLVSPGKKVKVEKLPQKAGEEVVFDNVLLASDENRAEIGMPTVQAKVTGKVLRQGKAKKVIILKYKPKKRETTKKGHRQQYTEVEITNIEF